MNDIIAEAIDKCSEFKLHPLNFFYFIKELGDGRRRRVHVWLPDIQGTATRVENERHQHSFDISSLILAGCMRSELFFFEESSGGRSREFAVSYADGRSLLRPTGRVGELQLISSFESGPGRSYFLKAGIIHRVEIVDVPCVSVLTTVDRSIPIFSYGNDDKEPPFLRRSANSYELEQIAAVMRSAG